VRLVLIRPAFLAATLISLSCPLPLPAPFGGGPGRVHAEPVARPVDEKRVVTPTRIALTADPWWARDKQLHLLASGALATLGYGAAALADQPEPVRLAVGAGLGLGAGLAKEAVDLLGAGDASHRDLAWDLVGTASGLLLAWMADRVIRLVQREPATSD
jgi:uncharacterized protein YfiM (DUF2279 family)